MATPKCDILRAGAAAAVYADCTGPACAVKQQADAQARLDQARYSPANMLTASARVVRPLLLANLQEAVYVPSRTLAAQYGGAVDIRWSDFPACRTSAGPYFGRRDLALMGYVPRPALAAGVLSNGAAVPAAALAVVPVWLDRVFNPALSAVLLFALLVTVLVAAGYYLAAGRRSKNGPAIPPSRP